MPAVEIEASIPKCGVDVRTMDDRLVTSYDTIYVPAVGDRLLIEPMNRSRGGERDAYEVVRREWDVDAETPTVILSVRAVADDPPQPGPALPF